MNTTSYWTINRKTKEQESSRKNLLKAEKYRALYLNSWMIPSLVGQLSNFTSKMRLKTQGAGNYATPGSFATFTGSLTGKVRADMLLKLRQMKPVTSTT